MDWFRIDEYRKMMIDDVRMHAYRHAIEALCPGQVVCDIGVGLGPLSLMALKAGAKRVYGIELRQEMLQLSAKIIGQNGFDSSSFIPLAGRSTEIELPEKVDIILSETLDFMGVGEKTVDYMRDALERFLKPDGWFIPQTLDCYIALASSRERQVYNDFWSCLLLEKYDLDYSEIARQYLTARDKCSIKQGELFSQWQPWQKIVFKNPSSFKNLSRTTLCALKEGEVTGFCYAFESQLAPGVNLSTFPDKPKTHWEQGFQSFPKSIKVCKGDLILIELKYIPSDDPLGIAYQINARHVPVSKTLSFLPDDA